MNIKCLKVFLGIATIAVTLLDTFVSEKEVEALIDEKLNELKS